MGMLDGRFVTLLGLVVVVGLSACGSADSPGHQSGATPPVQQTGAEEPETVTKESVDRWMTDLSNWNRWGETDVLGTINLITAENRIAAAGLVRQGVSVSMAHDALTDLAVDNPSPFELEVTATGAEATPEFPFCVDRFSTLYHGFGTTHLDALCQMFHNGKMFNGHSQGEVTEDGAQKYSIHHMRDGILTRGILMDIPRLLGLPYLEPGTAIYPKHLDVWEEMAGIQVGSGDAVLVRTGRWKLRESNGPWNIDQNAAGLHASCAKWLRERDVAVLGSDAASDVIPSGVEGAQLPIHQLVLV